MTFYSVTMKGTQTETVLIDKFIVPEEARAKFLEEVHRSAALLRTLPGFVEGYVYERTDGESRDNIMMSAAWKRGGISERQEEHTRGIQEDRFQPCRDHEKPERRSREGSVSTLILLTAVGRTRISLAVV